MMGIVLASNAHDGPARTLSPHVYSRGKPDEDPAFDGWLTHHLSQLYGPVVDEPIPAELLRRLEERLK
jgi:hypothetical protein